MNKHTPGPWETDKVAVRSGGPNGRQICLCEITVRGRPYDETYDEAIANARLIAAAPDLLEALKEWVGYVPSSTDEIEQARIDRAIAAIAKAEGN